MTVPRDEIAARIERVRQRYRALLEERPEAPSTWELRRDSLRFYVVLAEADEPDVDVELLEDALVVRAAAGRDVVHCLVPVPRPYRAHERSFLFRSGTLEIRLTVGAR